MADALDPQVRGSRGRLTMPPRDLVAVMYRCVRCPARWTERVAWQLAAHNPGGVVTGPCGPCSQAAVARVLGGQDG